MPNTSSVLPAYAPLVSHVVAAKLLGKNRHKEMIRGFYHLKESWYGNANLKDRTGGLVDSINVGFFSPDSDGGTTGEFCIQWIEMKGKVYPQLQVFDDAWEALTHFSDLLAEMAKETKFSLSPTEFCVILKRLGIKDLTKRTQP